MRALIFTMIMLASVASTFGQTTKEFSGVREQAARGVASAQYELGIAYFYGEGTASWDPATGIAYLSKAAEGGYSRAALELGLIFERQDYVSAREYLERVADEFPDAARALERIYREGLGVEPDAERAAMYQRMAE
jgi:TPR repeat protein